MGTGRTLAITFEVPTELAEATAFWLHEEQASGVELRDHETLPPPGLPPLPEGRAAVIGFFSQGADGEQVARRIRGALDELRGNQEIVVSLDWIDDEDWVDSWKLHFRPLHVGGRLWVVPPWERRPDREPAVVIEPGMAFGTGGHETTALCLDGVVELVKGGESVLDLGCGSGVLGIAAKRLGAGRTLLTDNDPVAVKVAQENAAENGADVEVAETPVEELDERFELVLANILASTLIELAEPVRRTVAPGGHLLVSGIKVEQENEVRRVYEGLGLRHEATSIKGEWVMIHMRG